ncbi:MAG: RNA polymerase sigma-70 factor [Actinomycetota bacterium]|nr:RNA polymerase sigma-70 factor [Actinomycetota bacterium]
MTQTVEGFEELRPYLFSIAYRMMGSVSEAEDIVQEAYLRWQRAPEDVSSPKAFLSKVVTRLCLDELGSARARRESYVGPWLPEPLLGEMPDASEGAERAESLSIAFLVVLESLSPLERAVFLLRDVFDYDYADIAEFVDRSEDACRQIAHRAKQHLTARRPRFPTTREQRDEITSRFLQACAMGDLESLRGLLSHDITLWSDGGGKVRAARRPIHGPDKVARFVLAILKKAPTDATTQIVPVNGQAGVLVYDEDGLASLLTLDVGEGAVQGIHIIANPDKLQSIRGV